MLQKILPLKFEPWPDLQPFIRAFNRLEENIDTTDRFVPAWTHNFIYFNYGDIYDMRLTDNTVLNCYPVTINAAVLFQGACVLYELKRTGSIQARVKLLKRFFSDQLKRLWVPSETPVKQTYKKMIKSERFTVTFQSEQPAEQKYRSCSDRQYTAFIKQK